MKILVEYERVGINTDNISGRNIYFNPRSSDTSQDWIIKLRNKGGKLVIGNHECYHDSILYLVKV